TSHPLKDLLRGGLGTEESLRHIDQLLVPTGLKRPQPGMRMIIIQDIGTGYRRLNFATGIQREDPSSGSQERGNIHR
ncbi:MAG: hypothetical protein NWE79_09175, partial [Candidatus Bathyarchaeota archaeon]|nr:hypothetical protein [Candidatus Bathyarchaeota archaeon]